MGAYQRITIDTVQWRRTTLWRVVIRWTGKNRSLTVAYCPNKQTALLLKKVLEADFDQVASPKTQPDCCRKLEGTRSVKSRR